MSDPIDELVDRQLEEGAEQDLLSCGYPSDDRLAQDQHGHQHVYHCHLSLDNYW